MTYRRCLNVLRRFQHFAQIDAIQRNLYLANLIVLSESVEIENGENDRFRRDFVEWHLKRAEVLWVRRVRDGPDQYRSRIQRTYLECKRFVEDGIKRFPMDFRLKFLVFLGQDIHLDVRVGCTTKIHGR